MPHNCTLYPWYLPAGSLITVLESQALRWGQPGWAQEYDDPNAYQELINLHAVLGVALADPSPWPPDPWVGNLMPSDGVAMLARDVRLGLLQDETSNPPPVPPPPPPPAHAPGNGWLLTPPNDPNWFAINRAQELLRRVREALDI